MRGPAGEIYLCTCGHEIDDHDGDLVCHARVRYVGCKHTTPDRDCTYQCHCMEFENDEAGEDARPNIRQLPVTIVAHPPGQYHVSLGLSIEQLEWIAANFPQPSVRSLLLSSLGALMSHMLQQEKRQ